MERGYFLMSIVVISGVLWLVSACSVLAQSVEYRLLVIEDEEVALVSGIRDGNSLFPVTLLAMATILFVLAVLHYFLQCRRYRLRIETLGDGKAQNDWNLKKLKEEAAELELRAAGKELQYE